MVVTVCDEPRHTHITPPRILTSTFCSDCNTHHLMEGLEQDNQWPCLLFSSSCWPTRSAGRSCIGHRLTVKEPLWISHASILWHQVDSMNQQQHSRKMAVLDSRTRTTTGAGGVNQLWKAVHCYVSVGGAAGLPSCTMVVQGELQQQRPVQHHHAACSPALAQTLYIAQRVAQSAISLSPC